MNESDLRSDVHYLGSSENKAWKKFRPVRDLNPWPVGRLLVFVSFVHGNILCVIQECKEKEMLVTQREKGSITWEFGS